MLTDSNIISQKNFHLSFILIDNNLGKLIKRGIVKINNEKIYCLTAHGEDLWLKYNKNWLYMPPLNKQQITHD